MSSIMYNVLYIIEDIVLYINKSRPFQDGPVLFVMPHNVDVILRQFVRHSVHILKPCLRQAGVEVSTINAILLRDVVEVSIHAF